MPHFPYFYPSSNPTSKRSLPTNKVKFLEKISIHFSFFICFIDSQMEICERFEDLDCCCFFVGGLPPKYSQWLYAGIPKIPSTVFFFAIEVSTWHLFILCFNFLVSLFIWMNSFFSPFQNAQRKLLICLKKSFAVSFRLHVWFPRITGRVENLTCRLSCCFFYFVRFFFCNFCFSINSFVSAATFLLSKRTLRAAKEIMQSSYAHRN